ncbi:hypothetical protein [Microbacterium paludicola]|jgi:hypothetical protein|uniref:hypothetical protein n=1 Tax=Microbacterium paludicola TaxID=300019 RepID=UPI0031DE58C2
MSRPEPGPISSTPVLRTALLWGGIATAVVAVAGGAIGFAIAGANGMLSAFAGAAIAAVFMLLTAVSILVANRWFADPLYVPIFFGVVLGGWLLKLVLFIVALVLLRGQPWIVPGVFFVALVVSVLASLAIDGIAMFRSRQPYVDVTLPGETSTDEGDAASR